MTTPKVTDPTRRKQVLSFANKMKLAEWMRAKLKQFQDERPTTEMVAEQATKALGFTVVKSHVVSVRHDLNYDWPKPKRTEQLKRANNVRWGRQLRLTRAVCKMLGELNGLVPVQLLRDAEITAEELSSKSLEQLLEEVAEGNEKV